MRTLPIYRLITDGRANVLITGARNAQEALQQGIKAVTRSSETGERSCDFNHFQVIKIEDGSTVDSSSTCGIFEFPARHSVLRKFG